MQDREAPLNVIQELLGHRSLESTKIYAHLNEAKKKREFERAFGTR